MRRSQPKTGEIVDAYSVGLCSRPAEEGVATVTAPRQPVVDFVRRSASQPGAASEQIVLPADQVIVTSKVCAETLKNGGVRSWFRWAPHAWSGGDSSSSACTSGGTPPGPRGALSGLRTGIHGAWSEGEAVPEAGLGVPCTSLQQRRLRRHDYCLPASKFAHAPPNETLWRRGATLVGNELHIDNFHHFNRDALFVARVLSRRMLAAADIAHVLVADSSDLVPWATEHMRAVLGPSLLTRAIFAPRRHGGLVQPQKMRLSSRSLLPPATNARFVCFETTVEKLVTDAVDRDSLAWMRARAYAHCGVPQDVERAARSSGGSRRPGERLLLLILRGESQLGDRPTTARQVANADELRSALSAYAVARGLRLEVTSFGGMDYCAQVRLAAAASVLIGVHGQGITNGQFMRDDSLVVELFHGGARPHWRAFDNVGHQPLYLGAGRPYVAAALAESECGMMQWKHSPKCRSYVNVSKLRSILRLVHRRLNQHVRHR